MKIQDVINTISEYYGFKKELICNVEVCGLWHVKFSVNHINYYGCVPYHGAEPTLTVVSDSYPYHWQGHPVTEAYYKEFIEGKTIYLRKCIDGEAGVWEYKDVTFETPEEAEEFIKALKNPSIYDYDIKD